MKKRIVFLTIIFLVLFSWVAFSQEASTGQQTAPKSVWEVFFDNALSITLLFMFISAIIGTILRNLAIDKCLRHFDDFHVTLELTNKDLLWGTLKMYNTGLELVYREPRVDSSGHLESSFILYNSEYDNIQSICRYHGDLTPKRRRTREKDIRKTYQPSIFSRAVRWLRNLMNTFSDAFSKALNLIIGQMKKVSPGSVILKQEAQISKIGTEIIGYAGNAYDPILERYIGRKVVVEINYSDKKEEYLGILKEYTPTFMELLNVRYMYTIDIPIKGKEVGHIEISGVYIVQQDGEYVLENRSATPVLVQTIAEGDKKSPIHIEIESGDKAIVFQDDYGIEEVSVTVTTTRVVDIIVPRAKALIRHAGPREKVGWKELLGLDEVGYFFGRFRKE
jgi:small nuclear ribonucleoprotein (snRNP)-like protein